MAKSLISIENSWQQLLHFSKRFVLKREEKKILASVLVTRCRQARSTRFTRIDCRLFSIGREMEKLWTCRGNSREGEEMGREGCSWRAGSSVQIFYMGGWHTQQTGQWPRSEKILGSFHKRGSNPPFVDRETRGRLTLFHESHLCFYVASTRCVSRIEPKTRDTAFVSFQNRKI